jgi:hypothetical protein
MAFPLPLDPHYRIEIIEWWIDDVYDRLELGLVDDAVISFGIARDLYLKLPGSVFDQALEDRIIAAQGKIYQTHSTNQ